MKTVVRALGVWRRVSRRERYRRTRPAMNTTNAMITRTIRIVYNMLSMVPKLRVFYAGRGREHADS